MGLVHSAWSRLRGGTLIPYTFGRFSIVRSSYSRVVGVLQSFGALERIDSAGPSIFGDLDVDEAAHCLRRDAVAVGLNIPTDTARELRDFAKNAPLRHWRTRRIFHASDVSEGRLPDGMPAVIAFVVGFNEQPAARRVAEDEGLLEVVGRHMGYAPQRVDVRALYSFAGDVSEPTRDFYGQTVRFHFDVKSLNFTYAFFYLDDVDDTTGAHEAVIGSHLDKPLRWLFASAFRDDEEIGAHYGQSRVKTIVGPAGNWLRRRQLLLPPGVGADPWRSHSDASSGTTDTRWSSSRKYLARRGSRG